MTKRERVAAALARAPVDRPPVAFWRHVPDLDHDPRQLAEAMLAFHRRWDLDLVKMMPSGVYCVEDWGCRVAYTGAPSGAKQSTKHAVEAPGDWSRIRALDPGAGALEREIDAVRLVARGRADDAPVLHTVFSPLTIARKLAGDRLHADLADDPARIEAALDAIAETMARYAVASLEAGADGFFMATQTACPDGATAAEHARFDTPFLRRVLDAVASRPAIVLLHAHGAGVYFDAVAALPVHAVNWHDRVTEPSLAEGARRFGGAVVGGLAERTTLRRGPAATVMTEVRESIAQTSGRGLIVGPGCVLPLDVPDKHLEAVVAAVKESA